MIITTVPGNFGSKEPSAKPSGPLDAGALESMRDFMNQDHTELAGITDERANELVRHEIDA